MDNHKILRSSEILNTWYMRLQKVELTFQIWFFWAMILRNLVRGYQYFISRKTGADILLKCRKSRYGYAQCQNLEENNLNFHYRENLKHNMKITYSQSCLMELFSFHSRLLTKRKKCFKSNNSSISKCSIFWDMTPYSPLKIYWRFGGTCHLRLQGRKISKAQLFTCFTLVSILAYSPALKMETKSSSETSADF
jgi:hypothetical protein